MKELDLDLDSATFYRAGAGTLKEQDAKIDIYKGYQQVLDGWKRLQAEYINRTGNESKGLLREIKNTEELLKKYEAYNIS